MMRRYCDFKTDEEQDAYCDGMTRMKYYVLTVLDEYPNWTAKEVKRYISDNLQIMEYIKEWLITNKVDKVEVNSIEDAMNLYLTVMAIYKRMNRKAEFDQIKRDLEAMGEDASGSYTACSMKHQSKIVNCIIGLNKEKIFTNQQVLICKIIQESSRKPLLF